MKATEKYNDVLVFFCAFAELMRLIVRGPTRPLADKLTESGPYWLTEGHVLQIVGVISHGMIMFWTRDKPAALRGRYAITTRIQITQTSEIEKR